MNIVSDRDTKFTIDFWIQIFEKLEITLNMSFIGTLKLMEKQNELIK